MFENFPVSVRQQGLLKVAYMHGSMNSDSFVIYMGLEHYVRHVHGEVVCEGGASIVSLTPSPNTHWYETREGEDERCEPTDQCSVVIELPRCWRLGVDVQKSTIRIIGVRMDPNEDLGHDVSFTVEET